MQHYSTVCVDVVLAHYGYIYMILSNLMPYMNIILYMCSAGFCGFVCVCVCVCVCLTFLSHLSIFESETINLVLP